MNTQVEQTAAPEDTKVGFPEITTVVRADRAMLAGMFSSDEECRYYLQGILIHTIEDGTVNIVGTNGHILGLFNDDRGFCRDEENFIVKLPKEAATLIKKETARGYEGWLVIHRGGSQRIAHVVRCDYDMQDIEARVSKLDTVWTGKVEIIDGVYPAYKNAIPGTLQEAGTPVIQSRYLNIFHLVAKSKLNTGCSLSALQFYAKDASSPVLVHAYERSDFVGAVMPVRAEGHFRLPSFAKKLPPKQEKGDKKTKRRTKDMEPA
ncbi:beta clamp domain-containing protein [Acetobacter senegalensis]|uniref:hypothetical protein n=1 Tax=Acetobacter senegalensis TaxID=446692 RepID=UPI001EDA9963|nr:hypothetical protein [Acetobacter senegalensis]MCG4256895.1 hypothetical protein [Acetobacter senegalensis]MCG4266967.1 hypothetical protein [Acetobacter senegalensis]